MTCLIALGAAVAVLWGSVKERIRKKNAAPDSALLDALKRDAAELNRLLEIKNPDSGTLKQIADVKRRLSETGSKLSANATDREDEATLARYRRWYGY